MLGMDSVEDELSFLMTKNILSSLPMSITLFCSVVYFNSGCRNVDYRLE